MPALQERQQGYCRVPSPVRYISNCEKFDIQGRIYALFLGSVSQVGRVGIDIYGGILADIVKEFRSQLFLPNGLRSRPGIRRYEHVYKHVAEDRKSSNRCNDARKHLGLSTFCSRSGS